MPERSAWTGSLDLPERIQVPIRMELDLSSATPSGTFIVGTEKTPIPELSHNGDSLVLKFSEYGAEMHAVWDGHQLTGEYLRIRSAGTKSFPFSVSPDAAPTTSQTFATAPPTGTFQVRFDDEKDDAVVARLSANHDGAYLGAFIAPDGDYGLLAGQAIDGKIQLSRFTGWQAVAIELQPSGKGWAGTLHAASMDKPRSFTLEPTDKELPVPASKQTSMKSPNSPFAFACSSSTGETVRNTDERFKGKALLVDIMGTWCHNCMDESPVLQKIYEKFPRNELEIVGLSFEINDDAELGKKNLALYRDRFRITYPMLYCGSVDDPDVDKQLKSQMQNFFAYPTTLFIDKKSKVQTVHAGFHGPGAGDEKYQSQIRKLNELAAQAAR